jgi:hypothetical protein
VQWYSAVVFSTHTGPPASFCFSGSLVVRSGLITDQVVPKSVDLKTTFPPTYTVSGSWVEGMIGVFQLKRYLSSLAGPPSLRRACGLMFSCTPVAKFVRTRLPPCDSLITMFGSRG